MKTLISITSIPNRFKYLEKTMESLKSNIGEDIDFALFLGKGNKYDSPYSQYVDDAGPFTKIKYASMSKEYDFIITADDDVIYPKNWARNLVDNMLKDSERALGYRGRILPENGNYSQSRVFFSKNIQQPSKVQILTGTWGCIYNNSHFGEDFLAPPPIFRNIDDIWINGYLASKGIGRYIIPFMGTIRPTEAHNVNSLWAKNKNGLSNNEGIKYFKNKFQ